MRQRRDGGNRRPPDRQPVLLQTWHEVIDALGGAEGLVIGGRSMGGRMASLIADAVGARGLVCLGYPFHPPGKPETSRTQHLAALCTPTLIVQGERDAFGSRAEVETYDSRTQSASTGSPTATTRSCRARSPATPRPSISPKRPRSPRGSSKRWTTQRRAEPGTMPVSEHRRRQQEINMTTYRRRHPRPGPHGQHHRRRDPRRRARSCCPMACPAPARAVEQLDLVAGCDLLPEKRAAFSERWGVPAVYEDLDDMIAKEQPDLVAICTRADVHSELAVRVANAGVPMMYLEKAIACSPREADAVLTACQAHGTAFNSGVLNRFSKTFGGGAQTH